MARDLTQFALDALKPSERRREVPDGHARGLFYVLQPSGAASWAFRYRFGGKPKKLTLGSSDLGLKAARERAAEARLALARGNDPAAVKREAKVAARAAAAEPERDLVETVVSTFIERYAKKQTREKTWRETERLLTREVVGAWRGRRLSAIKRSDVHDLLDKITDRPAPIVANRTFAALRRMCSWAEERGLIDASPCGKVRAPAPEQTRDRILSDDEIRVAWAAFDQVGWPFGHLAKLLLLSGQRLSEVAGMHWTEVDLGAKTWTIPKTRAKNQQEHVVPLSESALRILEALPQIEGGRTSVGLVFTTNGKTAVSGFSKAKRAFDKAIDAAKLDHWTLHDLRRSCASGMASLGIAPHIVESVLNHRSGTIKGVARVYNRYNYLSEKTSALQAWGRHLDTLISGAEAGNVVELAKARG